MPNEIAYIPDGPKNLAQIFPAVDWANVAEYFVEVLNPANEVIATTPSNIIGCCCNSDKVRLVFLNYLGTYDAVNFLKPKISHESNFEEYKKGLPNTLTKPSTGAERFNVQPNDLYEVINNCYNEEHMLWLQELADSPKAFLEWKGIQGQADSFLPIVITSKKFVKKKTQNDFRYDFIVEFKLSNEYLTIRN